MTEERSREEEEEETCGRTAEAGSRDLLDEELEADRREQSPVQQQQLQFSAAAEQQKTRSALMLRDQKDGKVREKLHNNRAFIDPKTNATYHAPVQKKLMC